MHLHIKENYFETGVPLEENKKKKSARGDDIYADIDCRCGPFTIDLCNM
jgi:hypothetical protein